MKEKIINISATLAGISLIALILRPVQPQAKINQQSAVLSECYNSHVDYKVETGEISVDEYELSLMAHLLMGECGAPAKKAITEPEPPVNTIIATVPETEVVEQPKPQIPPRPVMPPEATAFPRLQKVKVTLDKHNNLIFEAERERTKLEIELSDLKGLARLTKKKELESKIDTKTEEIRTLKAGLSGIVRQHGFVTVQDFYTAFYTAQRATDAYQKECAKWEESYGEKATPKAETMHEKLQRYQEMADRQNASQPYRSRDKGAR